MSGGVYKQKRGGSSFKWELKGFEGEMLYTCGAQRTQGCKAYKGYSGKNTAEEQSRGR